MSSMLSVGMGFSMSAIGLSWWYVMNWITFAKMSSSTTRTGTSALEDPQSPEPPEPDPEPPSDPSLSAVDTMFWISFDCCAISRAISNLPPLLETRVIFWPDSSACERASELATGRQRRK